MFVIPSQVMEETNTQIAWPSKLKIGAKSKKGKSLCLMNYSLFSVQTLPLFSLECVLSK